MRLSVLSPPDGWHFRDLSRSAAELGHAGEHSIEISHFDFGSLAGGLVDQKPTFNIDADAIFVRTMPSGSLEQIVFRMDLLQRLSLAGTRIVNSPKCVEASVDKYLSLTMLAAAGLPVPDTRISQTIQQALVDFEFFDRDVVVKPIFGSMGQGVVRLQDNADQLFTQLVKNANVIYQQRYIDHGGSDLRLLVIGERVWGMRRSSADQWVTNISRGGHGTPHIATPREQDIARQSCEAVGASIAGVDLVYDRCGQPYVLEVNAAVGWKEISRVLKIDFGKLILQQLVTDLASGG